MTFLPDFQEFNLTVVGINFTHTMDASERAGAANAAQGPEDGAEEDEEEGGDEAASTKAQNEKMLCSIAQATARGVVMSSKDLVAAMSALQNKAVRPTKNKCVLLLPGCGEGAADAADGGEAIEIVTFARAKRQSVPSLKKESKAGYDPTDPAGSGSGAVATQRTYRNPLHPDDEVLPQDLVKGYRYGKDYVPVSAADLGGMKVRFRCVWGECGELACVCARGRVRTQK